MERDKILLKSFTVIAETAWSANVNFSNSPAASICMFTPSAGGYTLTTKIIKTAANKPVITNTKSMFPNILPRRLILTILPTALAIVTNTNGVTAVNMRFKNISPKGFNITALSPNTRPIKLPIAIEIINITENL